MTIPITIPRLGWSMEEGIFQGWLKQHGEIVRPGDALFRLESDKATEDIECFDNGILQIATDGPNEGDRVSVGLVIGHLKVDKDVPAHANITPPPTPIQRQPPLTWDGSEPSHKTHQSVLRKALASPRARRLAKVNDIDWTKLQGTGRGKRIREQDVRRALAQRDPVIDNLLVGLTNVRRAGVERLLKSRQETIPVTLTTTAVATRLMSLRERLKTVPGGTNPAPTLTDILVKLTAAAMVRHPLLAARWSDGRLLQASAINIGIAVDTPAGLLVPVIRDVPSLSLARLAATSYDLLARAGQGKLSVREMEGGVFTVTNLGMFGIDAFTPIINYPECAILGVGRVRRVPACVGESIVPQDQMTLSLTFDHRIVDGAPAARFLQFLVRAMEDMDQHEM